MPIGKNATVGRSGETSCGAIGVPGSLNCWRGSSPASHFSHSVPSLDNDAILDQSPQFREFDGERWLTWAGIGRRCRMVGAVGGTMRSAAPGRAPGGSRRGTGVATGQSSASGAEGTINVVYLAPL